MKYYWTSEEDALLSGLSLEAQILYLRSLKPYVDFKTGISGLVKRHSYQEFTEVLAFVPCARSRIKPGPRPTREFLRARLAELERAGLIEQYKEDGDDKVTPLTFRLLSVQNGSFIKNLNTQSTTNEHPSVQAPIIDNNQIVTDVNDSKNTSVSPDTTPHFFNPLSLKDINKEKEREALTRKLDSIITRLDDIEAKIAQGPKYARRQKIVLKPSDSMALTTSVQNGIVQETIDAYRLSYRERYKIDPIINSTAQSVLSKVVDTIGLDAPGVVRFYVEESRPYYIQRCHDPLLLQSDLNSLRTKWNSKLNGVIIKDKDSSLVSLQNMIDDAESMQSLCFLE